MTGLLPLRRFVLLSLTMLSACGAADFGKSTPSAAAEAVSVSVDEPTGAYLAGRSALASGDANTAATLFLKGLALEPDNVDLQNAAFMATLRAGRPEATTLATQLPDGVAAQLLLANADAKSGHWTSAERRFAGIVQKGPIQILVPVLVAWSQYGAGRVDAALATLLPETENQRFRGLYALHAGLIADLAGRTALAGQMYSIAETGSGGTNAQLARILASWYARNGKSAEAQRAFAPFADNVGSFALVVPNLYRAAAEVQVHNAAEGLAEGYFALAGALRGQDGNDMTDLLVKLALDLRPDMTLARLLEAEIMDDAGRSEAALAVLEPVADSDPLMPLVQLRQAALYSKMGKTDKALSVLDQLQKAMPDRPESYTLRADILRDAKRFPEAVQAYTDAIARISKPSGDNWSLFYERGIAYDQSKQAEKGEKDFLHALTLAPDQPYVLNYLGYSWTEQGRNLDRAHKMIERAVALRPDDAAIVDSLGWLDLKQGNIKGSVQLLQRAVELEPTDPTLNEHLGDAYWAAGRKLEAQFQWRRALVFSPEVGDVPKLEAKLHNSEAVLGNPPATPKPASP